MCVGGVVMVVVVVVVGGGRHEAYRIRVVGVTINEFLQHPASETKGRGVGGEAKSG